MRGVRIQAIVNELNGEKIDVVEWNNDPGLFIANALSPAKVSTVVLDDTLENRTAIVVVPDKQLSLAIGKEGQNARLSAKLTGWRIDIKSETEAEAEGLDQYAKDLIAKRARLAAARARADSGDILSVAEQLLADDLPSETPAEGETPAETYLEEYADEYAEEYADEYEVEYGDVEPYQPADAPAEQPVPSMASPETPAVETVEVAPDQALDAYEGYDEYAQYEQQPGEATADTYEGYDEYAMYDEYVDYDEYAQYEGYEEDVNATEPSSTAVSDVRDKKTKKAGKAKDKRKVAKDKGPKRGRSDWYSYDAD
jgi:hypothetical protein